MEKIDTLLKTPKLELLKALTDKIKSFSLKASFSKLARIEESEKLLAKLPYCAFDNNFVITKVE